MKMHRTIGKLLTYEFPVHCSPEVGVAHVANCELNVNIGLKLAAYSTLLQTITQAQIFDAYLYLNSNGSNTVVGIGESIVGLTALIIMIPAATVVDQRDRGSICNLAANFAALGAVSSIIGLWMDSVVILFMSMIVWGVHWEFSNSASDCIFVDSLPIKDRTAMICRKTVVQTVACSLGIMIQLVFFFIFGNNWSTNLCKLLLIFGYALLTPVVMKLLYDMTDRRFTVTLASNGEVHPPHRISSDFKEGMAAETSSSMSNASSPTGAELPPMRPIGTEKEDELKTPLLITSPPVLSDDANTDEESYGQLNEHNREEKLLSRLTPMQGYVPYLVGLSDFVRAVGAGMTVKFFSLFFMEEYGFSPVAVTTLGMVYNLNIAIFTEQANSMAKVLGRTMTSTIYQVISVILFIVLYHTYQLQWVVVIYLVRGAAGNSFTALDRSLVADTTTVRHRGKWMAVESLSHVTWSGSAFIGGLLSDFYDYRTTFLYTSAVYGVALIIYLPVAFLFPKSCDAIPCDVPSSNLSGKQRDGAAFLEAPIEELPCDSYRTIRETHVALYHLRSMRDSMSMSRARGCSVSAPWAVESMLEREEYICFKQKQERLSTNNVIRRRSTALSSGHRGLSIS